MIMEIAERRGCGPGNAAGRSQARPEEVSGMAKEVLMMVRVQDETLAEIAELLTKAQDALRQADELLTMQAVTATEKADNCN